jgi:beta-galactosidase
VAHWGTVARLLKLDDKEAAVRVSTEIENQGASGAQVVLETLIRDRGDGIVARASLAGAVPSGIPTTISTVLQIPRPHRWSIADPFLYTVENLVKVNGQVVDVDRAPLGIRTIEFTAEGGFLLNGTRVPLQGVCQHHDQGPLGAAAYDRSIERQVEILKSMGVNAIRTSHNPPAPKLLEVCDRLGVVDGRGVRRVAPEHSLRLRPVLRRVERARSGRHDPPRPNHPSVVMWSIGNEIRAAERRERRGMAARPPPPPGGSTG